MQFDDYQKMIHQTRYARWIDDKGRRETWAETVTRYMEFMRGHLADKYSYEIPEALYKELYDAIYTHEIMPSMRCLMTAGPALERCNVAAYNCAYTPIDSMRAFDEILYILMCGTGVGFSVEREHIEQLPIINETMEASDSVIVVRDSKAGWAAALRELISSLCAGRVPTWDVSRVRPAGARLRTFGGRASGPDPLVDLFNFVVDTFRGAAGRKLTDIECHDLVCKIAEIVVVGGVRRSALISLSNLTSDRMRNAKSGQWWDTQAHRALANNSYTIDGGISVDSFMSEFLALYHSKSGERGIFSRDAARAQVAKTGRRSNEIGGRPIQWGTNPCSEIILRPQQFCNLTEVVARASDDAAALARKARLAAILGTFQSTLSDFKYLRKIWKLNTEEERLLGVSLTGIMDCPILWADDELSKKLLEDLKDVVVDANEAMARAIGINPSTATTCVKPSGTVSQLVNSASGIHARHAPFYKRTVRGDIKDPVTQFLIDQGVPNEPCVSKPESTVVFTFPIASPKEATFRDDLSAVQQLDVWKLFQDHWCEHKPSCTISVREHEWPEVQAWVWKNVNAVSGISFLPHSDHVYRQAPYQDITEDEYKELVAAFPSIDWVKLRDYETEDTTASSQTLACTGTICEVVDFGSN